mmetsp:Transcript_12670/g.25861  ORF Transcript_12670/g.25861 Transcript_12670/m.25861 type:complete len:145 (-) Transcript_12670:529-963(-)
MLMPRFPTETSSREATLTASATEKEPTFGRLQNRRRERKNPSQALRTRETGKTGKKHGKGVLSYEDGSEYRGEFKDGEKCGHGIYYYANGDSYIGSWKKDKRDGQGTYSFASCKSIYTGDWTSGKMTKGTWQLHDQSKKNIVQK